MTYQFPKSPKITLAKLSLSDYETEQVREIRALKQMGNLLCRLGVPVENAEGDLVNDKPFFSLNTHYERFDEGVLFRERIYGLGETLWWGLERLSYTDERVGHYPFLDHNELLKTLSVKTDPYERPTSTFKVINLCYASGSRPDCRHFVSGFFLKDRVQWVLTMMRHPQLRDALTRKEKGINKLFHLKDTEPRAVSRADAKRAIAHYAGIFMKGYRPFEG